MPDNIRDENSAYQALLAAINADDGATNKFKGVYNTEKAAALKAASFDRAALGARGLAACANIIKLTGRTTPSAASATCRQMYPLYRELYPALQSSFKTIARM